jgi:translation elongation factor EF-Ts
VVENIIEGKLKGYYEDKVLYNMDYLLSPEEEITVFW